MGRMKMLIVTQSKFNFPVHRYSSRKFTEEQPDKTVVEGQTLEERATSVAKIIGGLISEGFCPDHLLFPEVEAHRLATDILRREGLKLPDELLDRFEATAGAPDEKALTADEGIAS
jgi:hypothetical protein